MFPQPILARGSPVPRRTGPCVPAEWTAPSSQRPQAFAHQSALLGTLSSFCPLLSQLIPVYSSRLNITSSWKPPLKATPLPSLVWISPLPWALLYFSALSVSRRVQSTHLRALWEKEPFPPLFGIFSTWCGTGAGHGQHFNRLVFLDWLFDPKFCLLDVWL